ncbi:MAG: methylated-DNA--[protein]-cysteine S-methyltransferase, partial [Candidatus Geothermincolia bacterium]
MYEVQDCREVEVDVSGVVFRVAAGPRGLRKIVLPAMSAVVRDIAGTTRSRVQFGESELDEQTIAHLRHAGIFLAQILRGCAPSSVPEVDLAGQTDFTRKVLEVVGGIPWGGVMSYGSLAAAAGTPRAARAAGGAVGRNPVPLVVPCHRIVRSDGS